jgi:hypothetical protein
VPGRDEQTTRPQRAYRGERITESRAKPHRVFRKFELGDTRQQAERFPEKVEGRPRSPALVEANIF